MAPGRHVTVIGPVANMPFSHSYLLVDPTRLSPAPTSARFIAGGGGQAK